MVVRGLERATIGHRASPGPARPCGSRSTRSPEPRRARGESSWPASTGPSSRTSCSPAAPAGWPSGCARSPTPSQIADLSGYSPDLSLAQKVEVLETVDVETRLRLVLGWARETSPT